MTAVWSTPSDFAVSHIVTAAEYNAIGGASGDVVYLYNASYPTALTSYNTTSRLFGTTYQNTTAKMITVQATGTAGAGDVRTSLGGFVGSTSPGTLIVRQTAVGSATYSGCASITLIVPSNFYYTVSDASAPNPATQNLWIEYRNS